MNKPSHPPKLMLLGSGELGKNSLSGQRLGCTVVAVDNYAERLQCRWPTKQVWTYWMAKTQKSGPASADLVPEVEAIRTEALLELEASGVDVIPGATPPIKPRSATPSIVGAEELGLLTARYAYASSEAELIEAVTSNVGLPCDQAGDEFQRKGQSVAKAKRDLKKCWKHAQPA